MAESPGSRRRDPWLRLALVLGVLAALGVFYALGLHEYLSWDYVRGHVAALESLVGEHLVLAVVLFFLVYVAVTALSLPAALVLSLLGGALFKLWLGMAAVSLA